MPRDRPTFELTSPEAGSPRYFEENVKTAPMHKGQRAIINVEKEIAISHLKKYRTKSSVD